MEASKSRKYMFFLGCLIPYRVMSYEVSARKIARKIGIELVEMPEFYCCGLPVDQVSHELTILLSAQSLCMAEKAGLPIMTLCPGCYGTLNKVNQMLQEDRSLREEVNDHLREFGLKFEGNTKVRHLIQVLAEDVGLEMLTDFISNPLDNVVVAEHYGCHVLRPTKFSKFDNPEDPKILKSLIELTGAKCVNYVDEKECCGFPVAGIDENIVLNLVRDKLSHVKEARAEALITICPSCFLAYDVNQSRIKRMTGEEYSIPVLHYTELLSLAMGIDPKDLLLNEHRVRVDKFLAKI